MAADALAVEQVLVLLAASPRQIATLTDGLTATQSQTAPGPRQWSVNEVLAHLRACADVWGGCIATILAEDRPTLRAVNPRAWIKRTDYPVAEFAASLRAFTRQRTELLATLEPLPRERWARAATVTGAGKTLERTVLSYAGWLARHEQPHIEQIARIVAALRR